MQHSDNMVFRLQQICSVIYFCIMSACIQLHFSTWGQFQLCKYLFISHSNCTYIWFQKLFSFATLNKSFLDIKFEKKNKSDARMPDAVPKKKKKLNPVVSIFLTRFQWHHLQLVQKDLFSVCLAVCLQIGVVVSLQFMHSIFFYFCHITYETNCRCRFNFIWSIATLRWWHQMSYIYNCANQPHFRLHIYTQRVTLF